MSQPKGNQVYTLQLKKYLPMKLTHTPFFEASQRQVLDLRSQTWSEHNLYKMIACNFQYNQNQTSLL